MGGKKRRGGRREGKLKLIFKPSFVTFNIESFRVQEEQKDTLPSTAPTKDEDLVSRRWFYVRVILSSKKVVTERRNVCQHMEDDVHVVVCLESRREEGKEEMREVKVEGKQER